MAALRGHRPAHRARGTARPVDHGHTGVEGNACLDTTSMGTEIGCRAAVRGFSVQMQGARMTHKHCVHRLSEREQRLAGSDVERDVLPASQLR